MIRLLVTLILLVGFYRLGLAADLALPGSISIGTTPIGVTAKTKAKVVRRTHSRIPRKRPR